MICPTDQEELNEPSRKRPGLWHCVECEGVFLTRYALMEIFRSANVEGIDEEKSVSMDDTTALERSCPFCFVDNMVAKQVNEVSIDVCPKCNGIWLDAGELQTLAASCKVSQKGLDEADDDVDDSSGDTKRTNAIAPDHVAGVVVADGAMGIAEVIEGAAEALSGIFD